MAYSFTRHTAGQKIFAADINELQAAIEDLSTAETLQDVIGPFISDSTTLDWTYNDAGNIVSAEVKDNSVAITKLSFTPATSTDLSAHTGNTSNPHNTTKAQLGLGNVPNTDATARANHTGTQSADTLTDGTTNKAFLATERTKLAGIAPNATAYTPRQAVHQTVAYAASITVDPTLGGVVQVGVLTGNLTINAPTSPQNGDILRFNFTQDGTGNRTVTYNAIFYTGSTTAQPLTLTANARSCATFVYSDGVWQ